MARAKSDRGATLAIVLWVLVALGALAFVAATAARIDLALTRAWRDHAMALGLAEAGVADALAALAVEGRTTGTLEGGLSTGSYHAAWEPVGPWIRVVATGDRPRARRTVEVWVVERTGDGLQIAAWREVQ